jgi:hypothetical protein
MAFNFVVRVGNLHWFGRLRRHTRSRLRQLRGQVRTHIVPTVFFPDPPTPPPLLTQPVMFTTDQKWTVALLKLLDDMNAPDYAFSKILKWAHSAQAEGYSFHPANGGLSRTRNTDVLFASLKNAKRLSPSVSMVVAARSK